MTRDDTIKLTIKSLLEVVQTGAKNIEISVMESYGKVTVRTAWCNLCLQLNSEQNLDLPQIEAIVQAIEREKEQGKRVIVYSIAYSLAPRGGKKANETGSNCCGTGGYGDRGRWIYWERRSSSRCRFGRAVVTVKMTSYIMRAYGSQSMTRLRCIT